MAIASEKLERKAGLQSFIVMHKVQQDKGIQVCEIGKPEADTIMYDKAISRNRGIHVLLNRSMTTEIKGIAGLQRGLMVYNRLLSTRVNRLYDKEGTDLRQE